MKKIISIILVGAAITTAALAYSSRQSTADSQSCGSCCKVSCSQDT